MMAAMRRLLGDSDEDHLADKIIEARQQRGSRAIAQTVIVACALAVPFIVYFAVAINFEIAVAMAVLGGAVFVYQLHLLRLFRLARYRPWIDWFNATFEISVGIIVVVIVAEGQGTAYAFTGSTAYLLPMSVMLSAVRLRRRLAIYTGLLAGVAYFVIYLLYRGRIDPALLEVLPSLETWSILQRSCFFVFSGFVAFLICQLMRRSVFEFSASVQLAAKVQRTFGRHVSERVATLLVDNENDALGEERDITVMFSDIRDFTAFSEHRAPSEVVEFLGDYFAVATDVIEARDGLFNKFTGDGFMALFDDARAAAAAAVELLDGLRSLRERWGDFEHKVGVGIHSGPAIVGTIGTPTRAEYTAIGDTVNVAARIEALTKRFDADILLSEATATRLGRTALVERIDEVVVRGRREPVSIFRLVHV